MGHESLHHDSTVKRCLYARRGFPEYWVRSLPDARLDVHHEPDDQYAYLPVTTHGAGDTIAPIMIEGIARAFDRAEARRRREVTLYWIEAVASARAGDSPPPSAG